MPRLPTSERLRVEHRGDREPNDWYQEEPWAIEALLDAETFPGPILDPACGEGRIVDACTARGLSAMGSDIVMRESTCLRIAGSVDFLEHNWGARIPFASIICNPPYKLAEDFVDKALSVASSKIAMLGRLAFLEGQKRQAKWRAWPCTRIYTLSKRINMPPAGRGITAKGGAVAFAWFVFEPGYRGEPVMDWLPLPNDGDSTCTI